MIPFTHPNFEQMLNALTEEAKDIPIKEVMRKLLKVQFERDVAMSFAENFCGATGDITELVNGFAQFKKFAGEA
jgi:hypothetical protein